MTDIISCCMQASSFPSFADAGEGNGVKVHFLRKAQLAVVDLYLRFHAANPLFNFVDMADVAADSGAYSVAQLRARGCVECSAECAQRIADGGEIPTGARERGLRAAAVVAGGALAETLGVDAWKVSRWMQHQVDTKREGDLQLHRTEQTVAY